MVVVSTGVLELGDADRGDLLLPSDSLGGFLPPALTELPPADWRRSGEDECFDLWLGG